MAASMMMAWAGVRMSLMLLGGVLSIRLTPPAWHGLIYLYWGVIGLAAVISQRWQVRWSLIFLLSTLAYGGGVLAIYLLW